MLLKEGMLEDSFFLGSAIVHKQFLERDKVFEVYEFSDNDFSQAQILLRVQKYQELLQVPTFAFYSFSKRRREGDRCNGSNLIKYI